MDIQTKTDSDVVYFEEVTSLDQQLSELLALFHKHAIKYWLDSGTLLGLVRDGELMAHDKDIDISVWETEREKIKELFPSLRQKGYLIHPVLYRGRVYHYKLDPVNKKNPRIVDINIFCVDGEYAWCPMYYFKLNTSREETGRKRNRLTRGLFSFLKNILRWGWNTVRAKLSFTIETSALPWRFFVNQAVWWIPCVYLKEVVYNRNFNAFIPVRFQEYLEFRYGDWQEPRKNWVFSRDDGGLIREAPEKLVSALSKKQKAFPGGVED